MDQLKKIFDQIEKALLSEDVEEGLDKVGDYCKAGAKIIRDLRTGSISVMSAEEDAELTELHNRCMQLESKVRQKFSPESKAAKEGFSGVKADAKFDPATLLFIFQTITAIIKIIRDRRQG